MATLSTLTPPFSAAGGASPASETGRRVRGSVARAICMGITPGADAEAVPPRPSPIAAIGAGARFTAALA